MNYILEMISHMSTIPSNSISNDENLLKMLSAYHAIPCEDVLLGQKLTWCLEHCTHKFRDLKHHSDQRIWYFEDAKDASLFAMKWCS